jgi:hypothetical protein
LSAHWLKRGLLVAPPGPQPWASSHAALPTVYRDGASTRTVYYSPRDSRGRASVARAALRATDAGLTVSDFDPQPVLEPGSLGTFDDAGVTVSCVVKAEESVYLYYTGWSLGVSVPFYFYVGLAVSVDGGSTFTRASAAPILERDQTDPFLTASPFVMLDEGRWRMWYVSCVDWQVVDGVPRHRYHVKYAESEDGVWWRRQGIVSIDFKNDEEYAISRPCVVRNGDDYRMWFSSRGDRYRLGYAESGDGVTWSRRDAAPGLEPSDSGWDAEMVAYPFVFECAGSLHVLYNGNGYGRSGIGYATLESDAPR